MASQKNIIHREAKQSIESPAKDFREYTPRSPKGVSKPRVVLKIHLFTLTDLGIACRGRPRFLTRDYLCNSGKCEGASRRTSPGKLDRETAPALSPFARSPLLHITSGLQRNGAADVSSLLLHAFDLFITGRISGSSRLFTVSTGHCGDRDRFACRWRIALQTELSNRHLHDPASSRNSLDEHKPFPVCSFSSY